jgi:hypothetical protein
LLLNTDEIPAWAIHYRAASLVIRVISPGKAIQIQRKYVSSLADREISSYAGVLYKMPFGIIVSDRSLRMS